MSKADKIVAAAEAESNPPKDGPDKDDKQFTKREHGDTLAVLSVSDRIRTIEDALKFGEIDEALWYVADSECTSYEVAMRPRKYNEAGKRMSDTPTVVTLWRIKIKLKRRVTKIVERGCEALMQRMAEHSPKYPKLGKLAKVGDPHMLEVSLFDVHFGKLAWRLETGADYDLAIAESDYMAAIRDLIAKAASFPIERILMPLGQDYFHVDNKKNETTRGTPQDTDGRYAKIWAAGKWACIQAIELLAQIAPVEAIYVPGNHDDLASFHLCEYVGAHFRHSDRVKADCTPTSRKYVPYGPVVLGFTHGDDEKHADLPAIMLHEARELMASRRTLEIHTGHYHKAKETKHVNTDTHAGGVRVRILPSLSGTDRWHYAHGYVGSMRAAEAYLWSKSTGYVGHFSANVQGDEIAKRTA